jgi:WD40 repeat protein
LGLAVSADGRTAVSGDDYGQVRVWDLAIVRVDPRELTFHGGDVSPVAISADGQTAVSCGDSMVQVWDLADDREQAHWIADARVLAVAYSTAVIIAGDMAGQVHALQLNEPAAASA